IVPFIVILFFLESKPPNPPSFSAATVDTSATAATTTLPQEEIVWPFMEYLKNTTRLLKNVNMLVLLVLFGGGVGSFFAIGTVVEQTLSPYGYSSTDAGDLGVIMNMVGLAGAYFFGYLLDRTGEHKRLLSGATAVTGAMILWFAVSIQADNFLA